MTSSDVKQLALLAEGWRQRGKEMRAKYQGINPGQDEVASALEQLCETHAEELEELIYREEK